VVARPLRAALGELKPPELGGGQQAVPPAQRMVDSLESAEQATQAPVASVLTQAQAATVAPPRTAPSV